MSLHGDDHKIAGQKLPDDFPEIKNWSLQIERLREHRLRADYDNWEATDSEYEITPAEAARIAADFVESARSYLNPKYGVGL